MPTIDKLSMDLDNINAEIKQREQDLKQNHRLVELLPIITAKGKLKGELHHLTVKQYKRYIGSPPPPSIIKDGKIPWHLALDQLASERGFKSDEDLKEAIEHTKYDVELLAALKKERKHIINSIAYRIKEGAKAETETTKGKPPVFPESERTKLVITEIENKEILSRRNPSFWQVEIDDTTTEKRPDIKYRVRYSGQAKELVLAAVKDEQKRASEEKLNPILRRKIANKLLKDISKSRGRSPSVGTTRFTRR